MTWPKYSSNLFFIYVENAGHPDIFSQPNHTISLNSPFISRFCLLTSLYASVVLLALEWCHWFHWLWPWSGPL